MKKKLSILLLLAGIFSSSFAQHYYPMLDSAENRWNYSCNYFLVKQSEQTQSYPNCNYSNFVAFGNYTQFTAGDTVLNALTYKILMGENGSCIFGYVREDTALRKVYFLDVNNSPEITLYDFSMQPGDSMGINFILNNGFFSSGYYFLDSIRSRVIHHATGARRVFYLHCNSGPQRLEWTEGVGNLEHFVYPYSFNTQAYGWANSTGCSGQQYNFCQFLTCFEHNQKVYYDSCVRQFAAADPCMWYQDSCTYGPSCGAVPEAQAISSFSIVPNPAAECITIDLEMEHAAYTEVVISDVDGKRMFKTIALGKLPEGRQKRTIDISALKDGFYLVQCKTGGGSVTRKLVVRH